MGSSEVQVKRKILVVDDDEIIVKVMKDQLSAKGFEVTAAYDGDEALKQIRADKPDLIISDINMPNLSGWKMAMQLKQDNATKDIPVILLSTMIEKEGAAESYEAGTYYLCKPLKSEVLLQKVNELIK